MEASPGIEPGYTDLQSAASPLRHEALQPTGGTPDICNYAEVDNHFAQKRDNKFQIPTARTGLNEREHHVASLPVTKRTHVVREMHACPVH